ncbi:MAG: bifunctional phosphoribosylaminoimidazolecarboxamide formyltransferase/IMP cyclohydrolase [Coriobacteriia bacterium]|nr:bifunctional phosphoribosylaminoimidazolecarboxamide formyltransferase/IMP cyclohydrolase [Coriobacteriia bacterium]
MSEPAIKRALVSVTDKTGVVEFCRALSAEFGVEIVSTGGTASALEAGGVPVRAIDDLTGFPEMMDGRVKTLHPRVHGGLLARRGDEAHMAAAAEHGIGMIDLVCVNLYAFEETVAREDVTEEDAIENIDIGGPSMLRSAAKNFESVTVVTRPEQYAEVLAEMRMNDGATTRATRRTYATEVFAVTAAYDGAIAEYLSDGDIKQVALQKVQDLRYGENPHQRAAFYRLGSAADVVGTLAGAEQLQGKELSYNNILDTDAAWSAVREFLAPTCAIIKHTNPCGLASRDDANGGIAEAYRVAHEVDSISAFGGVMAFNRPVTAELVEAIFANKQFVEAIIAPDVDAAARELLTEKPNLRVLCTGAVLSAGGGYEMRSVEGGVLVQQADAVATDEGSPEDPAGFTVPTKRAPTPEEMEQLLFAWRVVKSVKSNAIVLVKDFCTVGVGAGQMNRVNSARIAVEQAGAAAADSVCASDAFMPFPDSLEVVAEAGATAVIQPGGSIRDDEVIARADELGVAMVFTGHRHFRH